MAVHVRHLMQALLDASDRALLEGRPQELRFNGEEWMVTPSVRDGGVPWTRFDGAMWLPISPGLSTGARPQIELSFAMPASYVAHWAVDMLVALGCERPS